MALLERITGADAEELATKLPGLFTVVQESGEAVAEVAPVQGHPHLHEKARQATSWRSLVLKCMLCCLAASGVCSFTRGAGRAAQQDRAVAMGCAGLEQ